MPTTTVYSGSAADKANAHLEAGGVIQITTYTRSTLYSQKHAGWFFMRGSNLHVKAGRGSNCLSLGDRTLVSIRYGRYR